MDCARIGQGDWARRSQKQRSFGRDQLWGAMVPTGVSPKNSQPTAGKIKSAQGSMAPCSTLAAWHRGRASQPVAAEWMKGWASQGSMVITKLVPSIESHTLAPGTENSTQGLFRHTIRLPLLSASCTVTVDTVLSTTFNDAIS